MNQLLYKYGPINETLLQLGWIDNYIDFLTNPLNAKISVILVNVWVGCAIYDANYLWNINEYS